MLCTQKLPTSPRSARPRLGASLLTRNPRACLKILDGGQDICRWMAAHNWHLGNFQNGFKADTAKKSIERTCVACGGGRSGVACIGAFIWSESMGALRCL